MSGDFTTADSQNIKAAVGLDLGNSETFDLMAFLNNENTVWVYKDNTIDAATLTSLKTLNGIPDTASQWQISYGYGNYTYPIWSDDDLGNMTFSGYEQSSYQTGYQWYRESPFGYASDDLHTQEAIPLKQRFMIQ